MHTWLLHTGRLACRQAGGGQAGWRWAGRQAGGGGLTLVDSGWLSFPKASAISEMPCWRQLAAAAGESCLRKCANRVLDRGEYLKEHGEHFKGPRFGNTKAGIHVSGRCVNWMDVAQVPLGWSCIETRRLSVMAQHFNTS